VLMAGLAVGLAVTTDPRVLVPAVVFAGTPVLLLALMLKWRDPMLARLAGEPLEQKETHRPTRWGACEMCEDTNTRVVAPMWCASMLVVTTRWVGEFHRLCPHHAFLRSLPATIFSFMFGWWGFPWGLVWTPNALYQNLFEGGVEVDSHHLTELKNSDPLHGQWQSYVPPIAMAMGILGLPAVVFFLFVAVTPHR
jgi:hypothetical protein